MPAGALKERVSFAVRNEQDDGYGNTVAGWIEQFRMLPRIHSYAGWRGGNFRPP